MSTHTSPRQCLANLSQRRTDGGRVEFFGQRERFIGTEQEMPTGDCAVVALVHAAFWPVTGQSYGEARSHLSSAIRTWMYKERKMGEERLDSLYRRIKQWLRAPGRDPIHGTPSHATGDCIRNLLGYEHIYPNEENRWHCICDITCTYVLDIQAPWDHTMTVHQRVAYTTAEFNPHETDVGNVHRLNAQRTRNYKAQGQYKEAERRWFQEWVESDGSQLPDWESRPKLEEYLRN